MGRWWEASPVELEVAKVPQQRSPPSNHFVQVVFDAFGSSRLSPAFEVAPIDARFFLEGPLLSAMISTEEFES